MIRLTFCNKISHVFNDAPQIFGNRYGCDIHFDGRPTRRPRNVKVLIRESDDAEVERVQGF